jgi:MFS family permease
MVIALFVYLLALGCWLGAMVFFSFITAPTLFTRLPIAEAGKVVAGIFPRYYLLGSILGAIALALAAYFAAVRGARGWWSTAAFALAIALALTLYAGFVVRPRIDAIRTVAEAERPDPAEKAEFDRLHRLSVMLNGAMILLDLAALVTTAGALTPRG